MKWKYRIIKLYDGTFATQSKSGGFWGLLDGWSTAITHETYLDAQSHCKRMIQLNKEDETVKNKLKKPLKIVEIFE